MGDYKKLGGLDTFKIVAAFLVVAIHTSPLSAFSAQADFIFTRIIARIAVPFFLMVTGYFMLSGYLFHKEKNTDLLFHWIKKVLLLYAVAMVLYLPLNFYAGQFKGVGISGILRMILFDGTFYHLWYFPASILGVLIVYLLSRRFSFYTVLGITVLLYCAGLFGDSYYGFLGTYSIPRELYDKLFCVFSYTRNGIFYAPIFLVMGAGIAYRKQPESQKLNIVGFVISFAVLLFEGLLLHYLEVQRHDSMYIGLLPCMYFLYQLILSVKKKPVKCLRTISAWIYVIHPLFIVAVRGGAKIIHLERLFIDNSLVHYIAVSVLSCIFSVIIATLTTLKHRDSFCQGRAWIEVSAKNLSQNVDALCDLLPPGGQLMPAIKANAYGHGGTFIAKELNACGVKAFCVAAVHEGVELRRNGIKGKILVLGYTHPKQFPLLRKYHLMQTVVDYNYAKVLNSYGKKIRVHLKIDTGMHRLGVRCENLEELCNIFRCKNLVVEGAYTHLCVADTVSVADKEFTLAQGKAFFDVVAQLEKRGFYCPKVHLQASYGLIYYPGLSGDYARIGIALYGVLSNRADLDHCPVKLSPILSIKTRVAAVKDLFKGEAAGYGLQYTAEQDKIIAVLTIGYADGLPRSLSGGAGKVLINGSEAPIIGRICMDQTLVDITDIPNVKQGDIAVVIGKSGKSEITVYDIAEQTGTITNEVLSRLGNRLERTII